MTSDDNHERNANTATDWVCPNCHEQNDAGYRTCWNCMTALDGEMAPAFDASDEECEEPDEGDSEPDWSPPQYSMGSIFLVVAGAALTLSIGQSVSKRAAMIAGAGFLIGAFSANLLRDKAPDLRQKVLIAELVIFFLLVLFEATRR